jgi:hypothetical protein
LDALGLDHGQILTLVGVWLCYFLIHSLTASLYLKRLVARRWPGLLPGYRLGFNLLSLLTLLPPLWLIYAWHGPWLWQWTGSGWWLANGIGLLAVLGFAWSLRHYDGDEFTGLRQWRERRASAEDQESFFISPLHRFVRHPWYLMALAIIWTRDMDGVFLLSGLLMSGYFVIGSRLEERKLIEYHGKRYLRYRERVPALLPLPWRYLRRDEVQRILSG